MKKIPTQFERVKLRDWLNLSDLYEEILSAIDIHIIVELIDKYISIALKGFNIEERPWIETVEVLNKIININKPSKEIPSLRSNIEAKKHSWDYPGRTWYFWLHIFAKEYGWKSEYIADLDVDDALGLMQEVIVDDQLNKEWDWMLSEIAYPYDSASKKSIFKPLERPIWMKQVYVEQELPKVKILKAHLPVGNIIRTRDDIKH